MPPLWGSHLVFVAVPGVWGFESALSTPSQAAPYGAPVFASRFARLLRRGRPPPGYFIPPLRGSKFRSLAARKLLVNFRFIGLLSPLRPTRAQRGGRGWSRRPRQCLPRSRESHCRRYPPHKAGQVPFCLPMSACRL